MSEAIVDAAKDKPTQVSSSALRQGLQMHAGLWRDNPALVQLLGLCPLLAVSNSTVNALALALATCATLLITNVSVSLLRHHLVSTVRLPIYVLIIASTVTSIELLMQAFLPAIHASLGIFLPLIVTNCLIIGRAEAFASRHPAPSAIKDALAMGLGFSWVLICLGAARELIGSGSVLADAHLLFGDAARHWALHLINEEHTVLLALLPPGAFLLLGLMLAAKNAIDLHTTNKQHNKAD